MIKLKQKIISCYKWIKAKFVWLFLGTAVLASGATLLPKDTSIVYKNNNMTVEFVNKDIVIGQALLKSHKTYDEVLKITSGKDKVVIWYEFSDFKDIKKRGLGEVKFIDMREEIVDEFKEYTKIEDIRIILNPNYLLPIEKEYRLVYLEDGEWISYDSFDIPKENITIGVQTDLGWGEYLDVRLNVLGSKLDRHAVVLGVSAGFVTEAPVDDPEASRVTMDDSAWALKAVAPVGAIKVVEIGWWCDDATEESNFEVGIYDHNAGDNNPEAVVGSLSQTNAKGTNAGWKRVTGLDIPITAENTYWIAVQLDNTSTLTALDFTDSIGRMSLKSSATSLTAPWGTDSWTPGWLGGIYAVWEAGGEEDRRIIIIQ